MASESLPLPGSSSETLLVSPRAHQLKLRHVPPPKRQLRLLDLPVDVLKEIIDQLPHANDLTSLALCHSTLHSLTIPCIYSRFDIVWPEQGTQSDSRAGVDALTYGLATLVKAQEVFGEAAFQQAQRTNKSGFVDPYPIRRRRLGNSYAAYTKKFSLGNGPPDCVQEYLITKEAGKMLGTLIALAVARMPNLESFIWDMPTGVLRDVWLALSSLGDAGEDCKLDKIWVRWHNNYGLEAGNDPPPPPPQLNGVTTPSISADRPNSRAQIGSGIGGSGLPLEHPSFSVLPPLKSLTVLEIDELVYLDEMSILIARSAHRLKELRVGMALHAKSTDWTANWEGDEYQQVDHDTTWTIASKVGHKRLQGVLGILVGRVYNLKNNDELAWQAQTMANLTTILNGPTKEPQTHSRSGSLSSQEYISAPNSRTNSMSTPRLHTELPIRSRTSMPIVETVKGPHLSGKLKLEVLELEHVDLSIPVLRQAFDWTCLTSITLLHCVGHERLWKLLKDKYANPIRRSIANRTLRSTWNYQLNLKHIQTNRVSSHLLSFVRDSLAPNTLQSVFLQDSFSWRSPVKIEAIFKDIVRRHHGSLKKLMIDSNSGLDNWTDLSDTDSGRWRRWSLDRSQMAYLTSGKMRNLREVAVSIDYSDWHLFIQRLPRMRQVRSLYIPHIVGHPHGSNLDLFEAAMGVVNIVSVCSEMELCYLAIGNKCFEILERQTGPLKRSGQSISTPRSDRFSGYEDDEDEDEEETDEDDETVDEEEELSSSEAEMDTPDDSSDDIDDDDDYYDRSRSSVPKRDVRLWLQEILFYDKITIFKCRHARL